MGGWAGLWGQGAAPDKAAKGMLHPPLKQQHLGVCVWVGGVVEVSDTPMTNNRK